MGHNIGYMIDNNRYSLTLVNATRMLILQAFVEKLFVHGNGENPICNQYFFQQNTHSIC